MTLARGVVDLVRRLFALSRGRPVFGRGIRTAFALLVPIVGGDLLGQPLFAWAALGGWLGSLADKGGSYRTRATTMVALLVLGAACSYAGTAAAYAVPVAVASMLLVGILGGLGRVYGDEGSTVGLFVAVLSRSMHAEVRSALEQARAMLAGVRRPRSGRSPRSEQLLVLTEGAEQLFGTLIAIESELEAAHEGGAAITDASFAISFARVASTLESVATAVDDTAARTTPPRADPGARSAPVGSPNIHLRAAATHLSRLARDLDVLTDTAPRIDERASSVMPPAPPPVQAPRTARDPLAWLRPLYEAISPRTFPMRHALRMGIASAATVWLSFALDITRGYWATITVLIVLQPYAGATVRKTLQRVAGSVGGGMLAAALAVVARSKLAIAGVMFPLTVGAVAVLPLNYGVFVFLLTPVFVLLAEPHSGDWGIAGLRVANALLGGAIALFASQLLWPARETATYAPQLAALLRMLRAQLLAVTGAGEPSLAAWRIAADEARRHVGVAVSNAEATMQRLITEDAPSAQRVEAAMTLLTYSRRIASTLSALAAARASGELMTLDDEGAALAAQLDSLVTSLEGSEAAAASAPASDAHPVAAVTDITVTPDSLQNAQLERLRTQFAVLQRAVARYESA